MSQKKKQQQQQQQLQQAIINHQLSIEEEARLNHSDLIKIWYKMVIEEQ